MHHILRRAGKWRIRSAAGLLVVLVGTSCAPNSQGATPSSSNPPVATAATTSTTFPNVTSTVPATTTSATTTTTSATTTPPTTPSITTTTGTTTTPPTTPASTLPRSGSAIYDVRPASDIAPPALPVGWSTEVIGASAQDREIVALLRKVDAPRRRVLVIGGLHGNEPVSPPTVEALVEAPHEEDVEVWLVPRANPDGIAAGTRWNGNGVDLNRNFSWGWRESDGGPDAFSEPETTALADLVEWLQPDVVVWIHQPYGYASSIGTTDPALEQAWADASGVQVRSGVTQHGGGESWTAFAAGYPSMLIEVDSWAATPAIVAAHRAGYEAMLAALG